MTILNDGYELVDVSTLIEHPDNPRRGRVDVISESIEANGFYGVLVVQRSTNRVLAGNHRLKAARSEGIAEVPVVWVDVDDVRALRILLADNRTADLASYDSNALVHLLQTVAVATQGVLDGTGYEQDDLARLLEAVTVTPPEEFRPLEPDAMDTQYRCPRCLFDWSGSPRPSENAAPE